MEHRTSEKYITDMASFSNKKFKCNLNESDSTDNETEAPFPRFIIIESNSAPITNLSPFIIEKLILTNLMSITVKNLKIKLCLLKWKRGNTDFLLKMTKFHNISAKTYPHKSLNVSKRVVRSKELSLCTIEEIKRELKKQIVTEVKSVSIKKEGKTIETNTYIMHFNTLKIHKRRQKREVLTVKHQNNIPYYEAHKLVVASKTTTYSQVVQCNKSPYKKYETIVKTLIQLEPGDWESFINKIKASSDTTRAADTPTTSVDLAENKEESSAQTQIQLGKTNTGGENGNKTNHTTNKTPCNKIFY